MEKADIQTWNMATGALVFVMVKNEEDKFDDVACLRLDCGFD